jgi:hypothetical protein
MHICGKSFGGPSLARIFTVDFDSLRVIVLRLPPVIVVWSLIALIVFVMWTEDLEDRPPGVIIWLIVGVTGFTCVLVILAA